MTTIEHLLSCLGEEAVEVSQMASKMNRFGIHEIYKNRKNPEHLTNRQRLVGELNDFVAVVELLVDEGVIPQDWQSGVLKALKRKKVRKYMDYARSIGTLRNDK